MSGYGSELWQGMDYPGGRAVARACRFWRRSSRNSKCTRSDRVSHQDAGLYSALGPPAHWSQAACSVEMGLKAKGKLREIKSKNPPSEAVRREREEEWNS
jgi:hypothetical protein